MPKKGSKGGRGMRRNSPIYTKREFVPVSHKELDFIFESIYQEVSSMELLSERARESLIQATAGQVLKFGKNGSIFADKKILEKIRDELKKKERCNRG